MPRPRYFVCVGSDPNSIKYIRLFCIQFKLLHICISKRRKCDRDLSSKAGATKAGGALVTLDWDERGHQQDWDQLGSHGPAGYWYCFSSQSHWASHVLQRFTGWTQVDRWWLECSWWRGSPHTVVTVTTLPPPLPVHYTVHWPVHYTTVHTGVLVLNCEEST